MASRKPRPRQQQPQTVYNPSDYESDANIVPEVPAPPRPRTNEQLNLAVLQRHNPAVTAILSIAPYAVVYLFSAVNQQWEKTGAEGTLFVCQVATDDIGAPGYVVTVLNRRGLDNFSAPLLDGGDVEITDDYVILQVGDDVAHKLIYGVWIFSEPAPSSTANTRAINAQIIKDCAVDAGLRQSQGFGYQPDQEVSQSGTEENTQGEVMTRQLSLHEILGQQREQDSAWSVRNHSTHPSGTQFIPSADTEFFRSNARPSKSFKQSDKPEARDGVIHSPSVPTPGPSTLLDLFRSAESTQIGNHQQTAPSQVGGGSQNVLLDLFRKAGEGHRVVE